MNEFQDKLTAKVSDTMQPSGFDPVILIPLILEFLTDILGSCASPQSIKKRLQNCSIDEHGRPTDFWVGYSLHKAMRAAAAQSCCHVTEKEKKTISQLVLQTCGELDDTALDNLLNEVEDNTSYILI